MAYAIALSLRANLASDAEIDTAGSTQAHVRPVGRAQTDPEMKELAFKSGFELVNIGVDRMVPFVRERTKAYTEVAKRLGLGKQ